MNDSCRLYLIDDEVDVTNSLKWLLDTVNYQTAVYNDPRAFLVDYPHETGPCILVADLRMPYLSGLDIFEEQRRLRREDPVIVLTGHGDVRTAVRAMKLGAFDFLLKPFNPQEFLDCIYRAAAQAQITHRRSSSRRAHAAQLARLSGRETEVFDRIIAGASSKEIAGTLGISPKTVDVHRSNILRKLEAKNVRELVHRFSGQDAPVS